MKIVMFSGFVVTQCQRFTLTSGFPDVLYEYGLRAV